MANWPNQERNVNMEWPKLPAYPIGMVPILESKIDHLQIVTR